MTRYRYAYLLALALPSLAWAGRGSTPEPAAAGPPPAPVIAFHQAPRLVMVPNSTVYVVGAESGDLPCDVFRYGVFWYAYHREHWYRARTYRGPFTWVEARYVPRAILSVPPRHWRHYPRGEIRAWRSAKGGELTAARER